MQWPKTDQNAEWDVFRASTLILFLQMATKGHQDSPENQAICDLSSKSHLLEMQIEKTNVSNRDPTWRGECCKECVTNVPQIGHTRCPYYCCNMMQVTHLCLLLTNLSSLPFRSWITFVDTWGHGTAASHVTIKSLPCGETVPWWC